MKGRITGDNLLLSDSPSMLVCGQVQLLIQNRLR